MVLAGDAREGFFPARTFAAKGASTVATCGDLDGSRHRRGKPLAVSCRPWPSALRSSGNWKAVGCRSRFLNLGQNLLH